MFYLIIDTNIYREDPARKSAFFRAVARLSQSGDVRLCIPYYTEKEFISHLVEECREQMESATNALRKLSFKRINNSDIKDLLNESHSNVVSIGLDMEKAIEEEFNEWLRSIKAIRLPISESHAKRVADAYFNGSYPFKKKKSREDFPDAFIYAAITDFQEKVPVHIVTHDKNLRNALAELENTTCYDSLRDFINRPDIRNILDALEEGDNLRKNLHLLKRSIETSMSFLRLRLNPIIRDAVMGEQAYGDDIPTDDGEAAVYSVRFINEVQLDLELLNYYGGGDIVVPFTASFDGTVAYTLDTEEFNDLDEDKFNHIDTEWESEYYARIKEPFTFSCKGTILFTLRNKVPKVKLDTYSARDLIERSDVVIDSIAEIAAQ